MNKKIALFLMMFILFVFTACALGDTASTPNPSSRLQATSEPNQPPHNTPLPSNTRIPFPSPNFY